MRINHKLGSLKLFYNHLIVYPTPVNLNYAWSFGSLAGIVLSAQLVTGILLAMHYVSHVDHAFASVIHLMYDVPSGMILRYAHANGASLFFTVVYMHVLRGIYYSSGNQPRELVWITGVVLLLAMIVTAFIGYVLPWGLYWPKMLYNVRDIQLKILSPVVLFLYYTGFSGDLAAFNMFSRVPAVKSGKPTCPTVLGVLRMIDVSRVRLDSPTNLVAICVGTLLGDGYAEKRGSSARLTLKQSLEHRGWIMWLHSRASRLDTFSNHGLCRSRRLDLLDNPSIPKVT